MRLLIPQTTVLALAMVSGCAAGSAQSWHVAPPVIRSALSTPARDAPTTRPRKRRPDASPGGVIERALNERGIRFGTDGTAGSLHAFLASHFSTVPAAKAQAGDVLFFDLGQGGCGSHAGLVEAADSSGRIAFREWRDGRQRRSYVHPAQPRARRDDSGRILNSFLRIKLPDDSDDTRYFAGEMLCQVVRPQ